VNGSGGWGLLAGLCLAAAGCAAVPVDLALRRHILMVDSDGELRDPAGDGEVVPDETDPPGGASPREAYFRELLEAMTRETEGSLQAHGRRRVILYIHGGLNSPDDGIERARKVLEEIGKDAAAGRDPPFLVFVNWDSSFVSCYLDHLFTIRQGKDRSGVWVMAAPFYLAADVLRGAASAPLLWFREIEIALGAETGEVRDADRRAAWYGGRGGLEVRRGSDGSAGILETIQRVVFVPARAATIPFVHGLGASAWRTMERRISMMFHTEKEFTAGQGSAAPRGALHLFLDGLRSHVGDGEGWELTLMGHSMGALVMNQMLRDAPGIHWRRIVYMASACTVRDYADTVVPYMERPGNADTQVVHLMLADRPERAEKYWDLVDVVPRGSLLTWVDAYLATPPTRLDRTAGRFVNFITAPSTILRREGVEERTRVWQFDGGDPDQPQQHGDFDEPRFRFWEEEWWRRAGGVEAGETAARE